MVDFKGVELQIKGEAFSSDETMYEPLYLFSSTSLDSSYEVSFFVVHLHLS